MDVCGPLYARKAARKDTYVPGFQIKEPLSGGAVGVVTVSKSPLFVEGDMVFSFFGWREAFNAPAEQVAKINAAKLSPELYLGAAGLPSLSAMSDCLR